MRSSSAHTFFKEVTDGDLQTYTETSAYYLNMLTDYAIPELQHQNALSDVVWMQNGTPPHVGFLIKRLFSQHFGGRVPTSFAVSVAIKVS